MAKELESFQEEEYDVYCGYDYYEDESPYADPNVAWGYIDSEGIEVIKPRFQAAYDFIGGLAKVKFNGKYGFINKNGSFVVEPVYEEADQFENGICRVVTEGKTGWIDQAGKMVISPRFNQQFVDEKILCFAENQHGKLGLVNTEGEVIVKPRFESMMDYDKGYAMVYENKNWGLIDRNGKYACPPEYGYIIGPFANGRVWTLKGKYLLRDTENRIICPTPFDWIYGNVGDLSIVSINKKFGVVDSDGNFMIKPEFTDIFEFKGSKDMFKISTAYRNSYDGKYGAVDLNGKIVLPPVYDSLEWDAKEGFFIIELNGKWGTADTTGNYIIEPTIDFGEDNWLILTLHFSDGLARIFKDDKYGFINTKGEVVIQPKFEFAGEFEKGKAIVRVDGKSTFIDKKGNFILGRNYESIFEEKGYYRVRTMEGGEEEWGLLNQEGQEIIKPQPLYIAGGYCEGKVKVMDGSQLFGFIDYKNGRVIRPRYDYALDFSEGLVAVGIRAKN